MNTHTIQKAGLWRLGRPAWHEVFSNLAEQIENQLPDIWDFWRRFRISVESGELRSREMMREIASIPNEIWDSGPEKVTKETARIEAKYRKQDAPEDIEATLARMPPAKAKQHTRFADAVQTHREKLPGTLEAILAYCRREIDRLQFRNVPYASAEEEAEAQRQIRVLTTIYTALDKLRQEIPAEWELSAQNIERGEKTHPRLSARLQGLASQECRRYGRQRLSRGACRCFSRLAANGRGVADGCGYGGNRDFRR